MSSVRKRMSIILSTCSILIPTLSFALCSDLGGLYEKRKELVKKYEEEVGNDYLKNKEKADLYAQQREVIDSKYRYAINAMFSEYDKKENKYFQQCCKVRIKDGYLFLVCKLLAYFRDGNAELFLRNIPFKKEDLNDLWTVDDILLSDPNYYSKSHPRIFDKASFVFLFLDTIYQLAIQGNVKAIDRFLTINLFANGGYAEYVENKILNLFENHPEIIIKNWNIVKKYIRSFRSPEYQFRANALKKKYQDLCSNKVYVLACKEVLEFLEDKDKGR